VEKKGVGVQCVVKRGANSMIGESKISGKKGRATNNTGGAR